MHMCVRTYVDVRMYLLLLYTNSVMRVGEGNSMTYIRSGPGYPSVLSLPLTCVHGPIARSSAVAVSGLLN